jgi:Fe2+ or Zn2+ uptake regulation protein
MVNEKLLKDNGYKLTKQRHAILEILEENSPLTAEEILTQITAKRKINLSTVYRNLAILLHLGLIRKTNSVGQADRFEIVKHHCTHSLLCLICGEKVTFSNCVFDQIVQEVESETRYQIKHHNFEIYGVCPKCNTHH